MNDYNSDQAKELRRARLLKVKPKAAPMMLTQSEFDREYVEYRFVSMEHLADLEETNNILFCPACAKDLNTAMGKRRVLHVSYEDDPLGNYPLIAVAKCQGCDWEEMIPVVKQELTADDQALLRRYYNAQATAKIRTDSLMGGGLLTPKLIADEYLTTFKDKLAFQDRSVEFVERRELVRFGQAKADRTWADLAKHEEERRDLAAAQSQIDRIKQIEAEQRAKTQARAVGKSAALGMTYGMGQTRMQDIQRQYNSMMGQQLSRQIDEDVLRQMQNMAFTEAEIAQIKKEPAEAAKAAHRVLIDKVKKVMGK